jgi:HlyD family secretion protein
MLVIAAAAIAAGLAWWFTQRGNVPTELVLYGNVDLRQADLAFNDSGRIADVLAQEGDVVRQGQALAHLDTSRLLPQIAQAEATVAAQQAAVDKLKNGNLPQQIAQARADVDLAKANADNASIQYQRLISLEATSGGRASTAQSVIDTAKAALDADNAQLAFNQQALDLAIAGSRVEDIAQGEAQLKAAIAQLALFQQQLKDAELIAPAGGVVRSRLLEPSEMTSPQLPVFSLALVDPKWVRAYVSEPDLVRVRPGMAAAVSVDGLPNQSFQGWVGFISPIAEFTPKTVQTDDLRTSLVYEVRVFVSDEQDALRLGMPATVRLPIGPQAAGDASGAKGRP